MLFNAFTLPLVLLISFAVTRTNSFIPTSVLKTPTVLFAASTESATTESATTSQAGSLEPLAMDRYYATNRFTVRKNKGPKFEQRWAKRKSKLATLPGFKYFNLMRRVKMEEDDTFADDFDYVSLTVWADKKSFNMWRSGEAFKEAHGGTSVWAFTKTMIQSLRVLKNAPSPAFYDGLLQLSNPPSSANAAKIVDGWREIEADGKEKLTAESFVATNQFYVPAENGPAFEARWAGRESSLKDLDGFVSFSLLRRDGRAKGHGVKALDPSEPTYQSTTIWRDRAAFQAWRDGQSFKKAHGSGGTDGTDGEKKKEEGGEKPPAPPKPLWSKPPKPVFYEGVLVISSESGA